ncbi:uncharacterized protein ACA1_345890 [Acanthamoeba castellanii str. Neff]|uniref:Uncharacterized protein n=1 Tax=Acanthamoeba castellanii (strain ATCC 30010 / Neff) TaxID=1257118 RepID=L8HG00_ACACF|nr:uncharacterized protein ACA1_345890 [Acanthamoeba castellanii str. Neff]ELR24464.1 hypothetical protein ACA1_345890 [Acanthamoeba castellanii str. Neff]
MHTRLMAVARERCKWATVKKQVHIEEDSNEERFIFDFIITLIITINMLGAWLMWNDHIEEVHVEVPVKEVTVEEGTFLFCQGQAAMWTVLFATSAVLLHQDFNTFTSLGLLTLVAKD